MILDVGVVETIFRISFLDSHKYTRNVLFCRIAHKWFVIFCDIVTHQERCVLFQQRRVAQIIFLEILIGRFVTTDQKLIEVSFRYQLACLRTESSVAFQFSEFNDIWNNHSYSVIDYATVQRYYNSCY